MSCGSCILPIGVNDDPRFGVSTYELKDVRRADPDPSLFKLPEDFTRSNHYRAKGT